MIFGLACLLFGVSLNLFVLLVNPTLHLTIFKLASEVIAVISAMFGLTAIYLFFRQCGKRNIGIAVLLILIGCGMLFLHICLLPFPAEPPPPATIVDNMGAMQLQPFVVNLADTDAAHYLRVKVGLMVDDKNAISELSENVALQMKIRDIILRILMRKTVADLIDEQGKQRLRAEIQNALTSYFKKPKLVDVMYTEFVIQL